MLRYGDMEEVCQGFPDESFDAVVTDPPYPGEFLPLFGKLAEQAARLLVPGGVALVMSGQMHLPTVYELLTSQQELIYRWTIGYLTPGEETRIWGRTIWSGWKPVIALTKGEPRGAWTKDVATSEGADKSHHYWGQSLSGMTGIMDAFVLPNSRILDPFCGGSSTLVAALVLGHEVVGIDNDPEAIKASLERLRERDAKTA
jgi:DNA modification methylase